MCGAAGTAPTANHPAVLEAVRRVVPGLTPWADFCYNSECQLRLGSHLLPSSRGVQQGDPLGPLLFALALQPVLQELASSRASGGLELVFSYLDDCCLAGEASAVARALQQLTAASAAIGLQLNLAKCELIPTAGPTTLLTEGSSPNKWCFVTTPTLSF